jgi:MFS family permease
MDFDDLKNSWQAQPVQTGTDQRRFAEQKDNWLKNRKRLLLSNVCMSIGFIVAMAVIAWVYFSFEKQYQWPFKVSIAMVYLLMVVFVIISWKSYAFKKIDFDVPGKGFVEYQIKKLHLQRDILTKYSWVYVVLLWLAMMLYAWEVTAKATATYRFTAMLIISAYMGGITAWGKLKKHKKQIKEVKALIEELENLKQGLE